MLTIFLYSHWCAKVSYLSLYATKGHQILDVDNLLQIYEFLLGLNHLVYMLLCLCNIILQFALRWWLIHWSRCCYWLDVILVCLVCNCFYRLSLLLLIILVQLKIWMILLTSVVYWGIWIICRLKNSVKSASLFIQYFFER